MLDQKRLCHYALVLKLCASAHQLHCQILLWTAMIAFSAVFICIIIVKFDENVLKDNCIWLFYIMECIGLSTMALFPLLWFREDMHQRSNFFRQLAAEVDAKASGFQRRLSEDFEVSVTAERSGRSRLSPSSASAPAALNDPSCHRKLTDDFESSVQNRISPSGSIRAAALNDPGFHRKLSDDFEYALSAERIARSQLSPTSTSSKKAS